MHTYQHTPLSFTTPTITNNQTKAKDRGAAAETKAVALADEAEGLAKKADDAHGRVVILQTTVQALRGEAAHVVEEQRKRAEAAKAPMQQAKELLSVAQEKQQAAAAMRARAAKLGIMRWGGEGG